MRQTTAFGREPEHVCPSGHCTHLRAPGEVTQKRPPIARDLLRRLVDGAEFRHSRRMQDGPRHDQRAGSLEVICGPMFSGKTEELIRRVRRAQIARLPVLVVKPRIDNRYDDNDVVSHSALRLASVAIDNAAAIEPLIKRQTTRIAMLGVDEAQFFDDEIIAVASRLADRGVRVIVAGLDQDYLGRPFGPMPQLLCLADAVTKQLSVCMVCGGAASRSQRVHPHAARLSRLPQPADGNPETVLVGGGDAYEARCRACYVQGIDTPSRTHT